MLDYSKYNLSDLEEAFKKIDKSKYPQNYRSIQKEIEKRSDSIKAKRLAKIKRQSKSKTDKMFASIELDVLTGKVKKLSTFKKNMLYVILWIITSIAYVFISSESSYINNTFYTNPTAIEKIIASLFWIGIHIGFILILVYFRKKAFLRKYNL